MDYGKFSFLTTVFFKVTLRIIKKSVFGHLLTPKNKYILVIILILTMIYFQINNHLENSV